MPVSTTLAPGSPLPAELVRVPLTTVVSTTSGTEPRLGSAAISACCPRLALAGSWTAWVNAPVPSVVAIASWSVSGIVPSR